MSLKLLMRKMNNILSRGKLLSVDSESKVPLLKVGLMANEIYDGLEYPQQFGFKAYPLKGCEVITAHFGGNRNHGTVLNVFDRQLMPPLEAGETCLYNAFNVLIKLDKEGKIVIRANDDTNITINADGHVVFSGDVSVAGNLSVSTINGIPISKTET